MELYGVAETALATLYGKAATSRSAACPAWTDPLAERAVARLNYDFSQLGVSDGSALAFALRAHHLDSWTRQALAERPEASVLNLGCGLDTRSHRIDYPPGVRWYDIDFPEVIEVWRRLFPCRPGHHTISASLTEPGWQAQVPADRPVVVIAEGLVQYFTEADVRQLLTMIATRFPSGVIMFDVYSSLALRIGSRHPLFKKTGTKPGTWAVDHPRTIETWAPGIQLDGRQRLYDVPGLAGTAWRTRTTAALINRIPLLRDMACLLRYRFGDPR